MNAKKLDQWFTKKEVAQKCVEKMVGMGFISEYTNVIEPSAGGGVFLDVLTDYVDPLYIHGYDLDPKRDDITYMDFLSNTIKINRSECVIIGNPPYGKKGKLAIEFINKALNLSDVVGFIVPITVSTSWTAQKNVREDAELIYEETLPKNSFTFEGKDTDVPSVFQVWRKHYKNIRLSKPKTEHPDLEIHIYNKTQTSEKWLSWDYDIAVKRTSKKGEFVLSGAGVECHWILIKAKNKCVVDNLLDIDWSKLNDNKMTAGMGKADVIKAYEGVLNDN